MDGADSVSYQQSSATAGFASPIVFARIFDRLTAEDTRLNLPSRFWTPFQQFSTVRGSHRLPSSTFACFLIRPFKIKLLNLSVRNLFGILS
jgi:hypothetical protein